VIVWRASGGNGTDPAPFERSHPWDLPFPETDRARHPFDVAPRNRSFGFSLACFLSVVGLAHADTLDELVIVRSPSPVISYPELEYVREHVAIDNNAATRIEFPRLAGVGDSLGVHFNAFATAIDFSALRGAYSVQVVGNPAATTIDLRSLYSVAWHVSIVGNDSLTDLRLDLLGETVDDLMIGGNPNMPAVNLPSVRQVGWNLGIQDNAAAEVVSMDALRFVHHHMAVTENASATDLRFPNLLLVDGDLTIRDHPAAEVIDLSNLITVVEDLDVTGNGDSVVLLPALRHVDGYMKLEAAGPSLDFREVEVAGDFTITGKGASSVRARIPGGQLHLTLDKDAATFEVGMATGAADPGSVVTVEARTLAASLPARDANGDVIPVRPVLSYSVEMSPAGLTDPVMEVTASFRLSELPSTTRTELLSAAAADSLTMAVLEEDGVYRLLDLCDVPSAPADGCVSLHFFDTAGNPVTSSDGATTLRLTTTIEHSGMVSVVVVPEPTGLGAVSAILLLFRRGKRARRGAA
jgi:hypothetical protein